MTIASTIIQEYGLHPRDTKFGTSLKCLLILFLGQNLETFYANNASIFSTKLLSHSSQVTHPDRHYSHLFV